MKRLFFFLERENDCYDYYLFELGVRKQKKKEKEKD
jgi:hypothetical protein